MENKKYILQLHASTTGAISITIVNAENHKHINELIDEDIVDGCYVFVLDSMPIITNDRMNRHGDNTIIYNYVTNTGKILGGNHTINKNENCIVEYCEHPVMIAVHDNYKEKMIEYTDSEIFEILKGIIENEKLNYNIEEINLDTYLSNWNEKNSFDWDSLDMILFIMEVENRFKINVEDDIFINIDNKSKISDVIQLIKNYIKNHNEKAGFS